uniref:VpaChn25_0724 family phage protein n=1 Tax=Amaricoccus sp. TaxID=1872485 RepID=UPI0025C13762
TDYAAARQRHVRLAILRHLEGSSEYTSNTSMLGDVLRGVGLPCTRDQVAGECAWLAEQGFAAVDGDGEFAVVRATGRGVELAQGAAAHPGVHRPRPRL